jgi:hypothetical protein
MAPTPPVVMWVQRLKRSWVRESSSPNSVRTKAPKKATAEAQTTMTRIVL